METSVEYILKHIGAPNWQKECAVLEFGVFQGKSLQTIIDNTSDTTKVFGFDTFYGLPEDWVDPDGKIVGRGKAGRFTTNGEFPKIRGRQPTFYKGLFYDTIHDYLIEHDNLKIKLMHIDCDLYSSTNHILRLMKYNIERDKPYIVFDEWFYNHSIKYKDHEQKAFLEWAQQNEINYRLIYYEDKSNSGDERQIVKIL